MEGFIPVRTVNAEYKLVVFLALASVVTGIVFCALHLKKRILRIPRPLLLFGGLFLGSVFLSSVFAHNFQRRVGLFPSLAPGSRSLCSFLGSRSLDKKKDRIFLGSLLTGGIVSCLVVMDQHYQWTEWSHGLPRTGLGGLIYNKNFAAEYHAPLLPVALGLIFFVRSNGFRIATGLGLVLVFFTCTDALPCQGGTGWLDGGILAMTLASLWGAWLAWRKKIRKTESSPNHLFPSEAAACLGLALPLYIQTSNHWNKDSWIFSSEKKDGGISSPPTNSMLFPKKPPT